MRKSAVASNENLIVELKDVIAHHIIWGWASHLTGVGPAIRLQATQRMSVRNLVSVDSLLRYNKKIFFVHDKSSESESPTSNLIWLPDSRETRSLPPGNSTAPQLVSLGRCHGQPLLRSSARPGPGPGPGPPDAAVTVLAALASTLRANLNHWHTTGNLPVTPSPTPPGRDADGLTMMTRIIMI
jgi:hypothetical protein